MIVDSSAVVAIVRDEPEGPAFAGKIVDEPKSFISAANFFEAALVVDGEKRPAASDKFDAIMRDLNIEILPLTVSQAHLARAAHRRFGRGSGHPAKLNFGDCFAYALAISRDEPLLFKGNDFGQTDVKVAQLEQ